MWDYDSEKWDKLKGFLLGGARGSRVLVKTREKKPRRLQIFQKLLNLTF